MRGQDLNLRPLGYEPSELPNCSTPRCKYKLTTASGCETHGQTSEVMATLWVLLKPLSIERDAPVTVLTEVLSDTAVYADGFGDKSGN